MMSRFNEVRARVQQTRRTGKAQFQGYLEIVGDYGPIKIPVGPWRDKKGDAYADARIAEHRHRRQRSAQPQDPPEDP